jgi:hypothetical protein
MREDMTNHCFAQIQTAKIVLEVFEIHPKRAVIFVHELESLFDRTRHTSHKLMLQPFDPPHLLELGSPAV